MIIHRKTEIERLALSFRKAIEHAHDDGRFTQRPFDNFPKDCCDDTSILLGQYIIDHGFGCKIARGEYFEDYYEESQRYSISYYHEWLKVDNYYVDITADQFINDKYFSGVKNLLSSCYVGTGNAFFRSFESIKYTSFYGIDDFPYETIARLNNLFKSICSYL